MHVNTYSVTGLISHSILLLLSASEREKENMEKTTLHQSGLEGEHVCNDMHAWLIAHLSDTDCDTH